MDVLKFFQSIHLKATEEELREIAKNNYTEEEVEEAKKFAESLGFDMANFCTEGNQWVRKLFGPHGERRYFDDIRNAAAKIRDAFSNFDSSFHSLIGMLYAIGFSQRDIILTIWRMGIRGIGENQIRKHVNANKFELERERLKFMELIQATKATVFQELQQEIRESEKKSALLYLKAINRLQEELEELDPVDEPSKYNRIVKQIDALQAKVNSMHCIDEFRKATVDTAAKISVLKAMKDIEKEGEASDGPPAPGKIIENEGVVSPFSSDDGKVIPIPRQQLAS